LYTGFPWFSSLVVYIPAMIFETVSLLQPLTCNDGRDPGGGTALLEGGGTAL